MTCSIVRAPLGSGRKDMGAPLLIATKGLQDRCPQMRLETLTRNELVRPFIVKSLGLTARPLIVS